MVIVASDNDLPQCKLGLQYLEEAENEGRVHVLAVKTMSIHRNNGKVRKFLKERSEWNDVDVLIIIAGWSNQITATADAILRNDFGNTNIVVIGGAIEDPDDPEHTKAAISGIIHAPGNQVVFENFVGEEGILNACAHAVRGELPVIKIPKPREVHHRSLKSALQFIKQKKEEKQS